MTYRFERGFTLQEALDIISGEEVEDGREIKALHIAPPESSVLTDEDSGDEDEGGLADNLSVKPLLADAEIRYTQDEHEMLNELDITSNVQADIFLDGNNTLDTSNVQGKSKDIFTDYQIICGKSAAPLLNLIDTLPTEKTELPYRFHIDNLFTSLRLLRYLFGVGYSAIGTIRSDHLPKCCPFMGKYNMKDTERGYYDYALRQEDGILICTWHNNGVVSIASNAHGVHTVTKVKRYSQAQKKHILVERPAVIGKYNESMGGTDRMDQNISNYQISMRSKKWYWPILTWLTDACVQNAWQLRRSSGSLQQPQLDFRRKLVTTYITRYGERSNGPGRPINSKRSISDSRVCDDIRYDGMNHLRVVISTPEKKKKAVRKRRLHFSWKNNVQQVQRWTLHRLLFNLSFYYICKKANLYPKKFIENV